MVLPSSTVAQSEAAEADWLTELRRWLTLGRKGVIIMIRDAQRARLRELVLMLDEIEPGFCIDTDAMVIGDLAPGSLVLLGLQRQQLDWLNLNRPLFAQRSLRVVLWAEGDLAVDLKFHAPDLHDWVSHFVTCPVGVPDFAVEGLARGLRWWPGVAWTGPGLELAVARMGLVGCPELDPLRNYSELVAIVQGNRDRCLIWQNVDSSIALWRIRWAIAEGRHHGRSILANPQIDTPGWYPVCSEQLSLADAMAIVAGTKTFRDVISVGLEPAAVADMTGRERDIAAIGLLQTTGPALRDRHESSEVQDWRRRLFELMLKASLPGFPWSRHELAIFAVEGYSRHVWPKWDVPLRMMWYEVERQLTWEDSVPDASSIRLMDLMGQHDIAARWREIYSDIKSTPLWRLTDDKGQTATITLAAKELGPTDPEFLLNSRMLGLVAGATGHASVAFTFLEQPASVAEQGRYPVIAGADFELSVVLAMLGRYAAALAEYERASERSKPPPGFEDFHRLTRAALGQLPIDDATQPLSTRVEFEGRLLLHKRLERRVAVDP